MSDQKPHESAALRFFHPSMDPDLISSELGLKAMRAWRAGEPRRTPDGQPLVGVQRSTYWCCTLGTIDDTSGSDEEEIGDVLRPWLIRLAAKGEFIRSISNSGGRGEVYVTLSSAPVLGNTFSVEILRTLVELNLELSVEFFETRQV